MDYGQHVTGYPGVQLIPSMYITDLEFSDGVVVFGGPPVPMQAILDRLTMQKSASKSKISLALLPNGQGKNVITTRNYNAHRAVFAASTRTVNMQ